MNQPSQRPSDDDKVWELLGRHQSIEPSVGFADRTMRRLTAEPPKPAWSWLPALRWAGVGLAALAVVVTLGIGQHARDTRRAELYVQTHQADYLDDFDVIAALDQLAGENQL